jgi:hypothetical protein
MILLSTLKKVLFWSYDRGTWQYDVLCVLILAFIFFGPNRFFATQPHRAFLSGAQRGQVLVSLEDIGAPPQGRLVEAITRHLTRVSGKDLAVSEVKPVSDENGHLVGYQVTVK